MYFKKQQGKYSEKMQAEITSLFESAADLSTAMITKLHGDELGRVLCVVEALMNLHEFAAYCRTLPVSKPGVQRWILRAKGKAT